MTTDNSITLSDLSFLLCKMSIKMSTLPLGHLAVPPSTPFLKLRLHTTALSRFSQISLSISFQSQWFLQMQVFLRCSHRNFLPSLYTYSLGNLIHTYILSYIYMLMSHRIKVAVKSYTQLPLAISNCSMSKVA